jgi:diguanylate cyclase (GGDEF)-like protein
MGPDPPIEGSAPGWYFRAVPGTVRNWHDLGMARSLAIHGTARKDETARPSSAARIHVVALVGGLVTLGLGLAAWAVTGGPSSLAQLVVVLDLTVGGTLLVTGSLVGRARSGEARRNAQVAVLAQTARRMSVGLEPEDVGLAVVEEIRRVIPYHNARVYLLEGDALVPVAFEGTVGAYEKVDLDILRTTVGEGFTGWVARYGTPIRVDDARRDPRGMTIPGTDDVDESMLVVPMRTDDRTIGVITLSKLGLHGFDEDDLRLLLILADQATTAFVGAEHLAETRRLAAELRQLLDMSSALSRSLDPKDVAALMAEHLVRAVGAERAQISDWDRAGDRVRTLGCYPPEDRGGMDDYYALSAFPLTARVLAEGVIATVDAEDPSADQAEAAELRREGMRSLIMLPLIAKGEAIGVVEITSREPPTDDPGRITLARTMAHEAAMALENARTYETARDLADRDPLTGFFNHRYLHERLSEEVVRAVRTRRPLSVVMLDLDDFKLVNDTCGHLYGDRVLVYVAETIRTSLRASDVAARYGGDEFALILPETTAHDAARVAERVLDAFRSTPFAADGRSPFPVGASIGIATHPGDGRTATELIAAADAGLYAAKAEGGNRVRIGALGQPISEVEPTAPSHASSGRQRTPSLGAAVGGEGGSGAV